MDNAAIAEYEMCCIVTNACGYTLKQGIVFVAFSTIIISMVTLFPSMMFLHTMSSKRPYNSQPVQAINLIFALICTSTALYEIIISIAMLWFLRRKRSVFLLSLWFGSNVVLLTIFCFLIVARTAVYLNFKEYVNAVLTFFFGIIYEVVFTYFCMIVSSYESSLDPATMYY